MELRFLEPDRVEIAEACVDGRLNEWRSNGKTVQKLCSVGEQGYPERPEKGQSLRSVNYLKI